MNRTHPPHQLKPVRTLINLIEAERVTLTDAIKAAPIQYRKRLVRSISGPRVREQFRRALGTIPSCDLQKTINTVTSKA